MRGETGVCTKIQILVRLFSTHCNTGEEGQSLPDWSILPVLLFRIGSLPYPQTLDHAGTNIKNRKVYR
jgi:hypothetical protein